MLVGTPVLGSTLWIAADHFGSVQSIEFGLISSSWAAICA